MNVPKVVIGAGFGDEGKGLITDYLCAKHGADVVVRFNGGAQAGHTVETPSGERHVFGHLSAGTFTGATTFLSEFFIVNPMAYFKELDIFATFVRAIPDVYVDPRALVTTPYDMLINQLAEDARGGSRHGSCGLGINETVTRAGYPSHRITFGELADADAVRTKLRGIRDVWFPDRCRYHGIDPANGQGVIGNQNIFDNFMNDALEMYGNVVTDDEGFLHNANQIIFEGAQGLLLDQHYGKFPHVTRSSTGLLNVLKIMDELGSDELDVTYVTRCYLTRHGAGPLDHELGKLPYPRVVDETNIPNNYQGHLRFSYLDCDELKNAIHHDLGLSADFKINPNLAVTCLDQLDNEEAKVYLNGTLQTFRGDAYGDVGDMINSVVGLRGSVIKSFGPTRTTIVER